MTASKKELQALLERVEKGDLNYTDAMIAVTTGWLKPYIDDGLRGYEAPDGRRTPFAAPWWEYGVYNEFPPSIAKVAERMEIPPFTASIDAAVALVEKVHPRVMPDLLREAINAVGKKHHLHATFWKTENGSYQAAVALALCAALLRALIARQP